MKHNLKITLLLLAMFVLAQVVGIYVANSYLPETIQVMNETSGEMINVSQYNLPYGLDPPEDVSPKTSLTSIVIALIVAILLLFTLMKFKAEIVLKVWFTVVVILGIALAINAFIINIPSSALIALVIALPLGVLKIFHRNIYLHNLTEILIYPGIASVFIPILSIWTVVLLLVLISLWDMYAVWKSGIMMKMARYQMENLKVFSGFFVPYIGKKERAMISKMKEMKLKGKMKKNKKFKVNVAILGGGDVVFPIILAGVVLRTLGIIPALVIALGATVSLALLFYFGQKGKAYPAMPFITAGCLIALAIAYFV